MTSWFARTREGFFARMRSRKFQLVLPAVRLPCKSSGVLGFVKVDYYSAELYSIITEVQVTIYV